MMTIDQEGIKKIIPHRDPFLFLDEVMECEVAKYTKALWRIREDLFCFKGHFPGNPILPGVLITEALAQAGAVAILQDERFKGRLAVFGGIDGVRYRGMVVPGDDLILETEILRLSAMGGKGKVKASVSGKTVCEGEILFVLVKQD
ncbi:3-hydroxyacyl-[acyl-carrier-protein] dehydratase FabZ [Christensenellaceae bacterium]|nr:3-hydroxyacyl-[acyl-carrier-protein] dehydratase FabZ [Christensenellaceae bacterium]BDF62226.1 3-hydroxyacyl-[acyl-carrier-protein] dehydratase FabZ [Christensenellaceae bacterium]